MRRVVIIAVAVHEAALGWMSDGPGMTDGPASSVGAALVAGPALRPARRAGPGNRGLAGSGHEECGADCEDADDRDHREAGGHLHR